jgi:pimeloyl-ACP methyl ester carboxylesterase
MWEVPMRELASHYRLWALDLIGFGDSRHRELTRVLTIHDQAEFVAAFCEAVGIRPYAVIGHSMGGAITLDLALNYPTLFDKMILVAPVVTGRLGFNIHQVLETAIGQAVLSKGHHLWPYLLRSAGVRLFVAPAYLDIQVTRRSVEDFKKATWAASYGGLKSMLKVGLDQRLHEIHIPTLVITGVRDGTVPPADSRLAAALISGAQLLEIKNCHHHVPDESPAVFNNAIAEFLGVGSVVQVG